MRRVAGQNQISLATAQAQNKLTSDHYRANFLWKAYKVRWEDPLFYHLVINTGLVSANQAAAMIVFASRQLVGQQGE